MHHSFIRFLSFFIMSFSLLAFVAVDGAYAQAKEDNILKKWFPLLFGEDGEPGPEDTLVAPFADNQQQKIRENKISTPELGSDQTKLDQSHISYKELQNWVVDKISTAMNFDDKTFANNLNVIRPHMSDDSVQSYVNFLGGQGIYSAVVENHKSVTSIITDVPTLTGYDQRCQDLISEFIQYGRYHWRFDVEIVYSILDKNTDSIEQVSAVGGNKVKLRVLVSRVPSSTNKEGLLILDWDVAHPCGP